MLSLLKSRYKLEVEKIVTLGPVRPDINLINLISTTYVTLEMLSFTLLIFKVRFFSFPSLYHVPNIVPKNPISERNRMDPSMNRTFKMDLEDSGDATKK